MYHVALGWAGLSAAGLATAATAGPDYTGIALLIGAIAGLISACTGSVIAFRRRPITEQDERTVKALQEIAEKLSPEAKP